MIIYPHISGFPKFDGMGSILFLLACSVPPSCLTLCNPMHCGPPGFFIRGISQARILEWIAVSFSRGSSPPRDQTYISCVAGGFFTTEPPGKSLFCP